jgi:flagellar hook-associated protein 1 FlgK
MANGMSSLMIGASGLKTAQAGLNTTAHNLANINTSGYTRQQIGFADSTYMSLQSIGNPYSSTYGTGVGVNAIRRIRETFIDRAYRTENGRYGYYNSQYKAVEEVEDLFGEMQGVTFESSMTNLYDSLNELSKEPSSTVVRSSLMQNASAFLTRADAVYEGLKDYQETLNEDVKNMVDTINDIANQIYDLNKQVAKIESAGKETANDVRDQRDQLLDELSEYVKISYYENENGETMVQVESVPMVTSAGVSEMSLRTAADNNLYIPTFPAYDRDVYSDDMLYGADSSDQGSLKGLLLARGCVNVDYTDVPVKPNKDDYDNEADYNNAYAVYEQKQSYYNRYIEPSVILSAIAGLDKLVNGICTNLDEVLHPTTSVVYDDDGVTVKENFSRTSALTDANGAELIPDYYEYTDSAEDVLYDSAHNEVKGVDPDKDGKYYYTSTEKLYTRTEKTGTLSTNGKSYTYTSSNDKLYDANGNTYYGTLGADGKTYEFSVGSAKLYEYNVVEPDKYNYSVLDMSKTDYGNDDDHTVGEGIFDREYTDQYVEVELNGEKYKVVNNANSNGLRSDYQLGNIIMNDATMQNVALLPFTNAQGKEDMARSQALLDVWTADFASLNPESYAVGDFTTFYNNFTGEFATVGKVLYNFVSQQQTMVDSYDDQRQQTEGVSSDEELQKMIKYQQSYNAASRYINVVSEMLEHLVTSLGNA